MRTRYRIVVLIVAVLSNILFWSGVVIDAAFMTPPSVKYGDPLTLSRLLNGLPRVSFMRVAQHTPPLLATLLFCSSVIAITALHRHRQNLSKAAPLYGSLWLLLSLPGVHGLFIAAFLLPNFLTYGSFDRELVDEDWLPRVAFAVWYVVVSLVCWFSMRSRSREYALLSRVSRRDTLDQPLEW
jgi:hypothetical protein